MSPEEKTQITIEALVDAPPEKVWRAFTTPEDIVCWNYATDEWHSPKAENDLRPGGVFVYRMEAKDGSFGFDFGGTYDDVRPKELIEYTLGDGRKVRVTFTAYGSQTKVVEAFEAEQTNPIEMQQMGWQAILNNFKKYVESV